MSAATQESKDDLTDHLNDLLGPDDTEEPEADEPAETEPEPEPEREAAKADEPEPAAEEEDEEEEPGNLRLDKAEPKAEEEPAEELSDAEKRAQAAEKRSAALQAELSKLRAERRQREQAAQLAQAPAPTREEPKAEAEAVDSHRIPVVVSEDGTSVYVDDDKLAARAAEIARREYEAANQPTPAQIRAEREAQLERAFVGANPERKPILDMARQADDYIGEMIGAERTRQHFQPKSIEELQSFNRWVVNQPQFRAQVDEYFPEISPVLDEFIEAYAADIPAWKQSVLERIAGSAMPPAEPAPSGASAPVQSVAGAPRSLARKGGTRSISPNSDQAEFQTLEKEFRDNPAMMPDKQYARMNELGKKLGEPGFE